MRRHDTAVISHLKRDRSAGSTITELMRKYALSKTTVWHHIKDIDIDETTRHRLRAQGGIFRGVKEWERAEAKATELLKAVEVEPAWPVLLAALYWSEGTKRREFVFTNTDEKMIGIFLSILRKRLHIPEADIDILIRTCAPMIPDACKKHWSNVTRISEKKNTY